MYKIFGGNVVVVAFQCFFTWKNIKIIFLISVYQNDLKTPKIYQFEAKKKIKIFHIFSKTLLKHKNKESFTKLS
jgi:ubiquitin C-terminal hydrolase